MNRIPNTSEAGEIATWMVSLGFEYQAPGTSTASAEWWKTNSKGEFELYCTSEQAAFFYAHTKAACDRATTLQPFEVQNYKRLMALETRGIEECREMREAPVLTAERVVSFINQLSPWNLKTTGVNVLNNYVKAQLSRIDRKQPE